ncbi:hypothetical protein BJY04DRAFT_186527 [Aspergillus karnatakaensis]|uniref:uncharacterized protein n=1 Tax=Aspergillus karnatakaensis TaxID=1810916 RepID=UPI003CCD58A3
MPPGRRQRQQRRSVLDRVAEYLSYHLRGPFVVALVGIITVGDLLCCVYYTVQFIQFLFGLYTARGTGQHTLYEPGYEQSEGRGPDMDVNVGWDQTRTETLGFTDRWLRVRPYVLGTLVSLKPLIQG